MSRHITLDTKLTRHIRLTDPETKRQEKTNAWTGGLIAAQRGETRAANPYVVKNPELAKNWDEGWKEGS